jgi:predicted phage baseplate assembly protein
MLDALGSQPVPPEEAEGDRPLATLRTRAADDETVALVDAWAGVVHVLDFYQERILNEGYLTTATELLSVTEIARAIGYEPDPGVAASTALAFTVDDTVPDAVVVPLQTPVQSVPRQDELMQTFETSAALEARAEWNALRPRPTRPEVIDHTTTRLQLQGAATGLTVGSALVVVGAERPATTGPGADLSERWDLRFVTAVDLVDNPDALTNGSTPGADGDQHPQHTLVTLDRPLGDGHTTPAQQDVRVLAFRDRAGIFGWNAPDPKVVPAEWRANRELMVGGAPDGASRWRGFGLEEDRTRKSLGGRGTRAPVLDLDAEHPAIVTGSWVCLDSPRRVELYRVLRVGPAGRVDFSLTSRLTRLHLDGDEGLDLMPRRGTTVHCASADLPRAPVPDTGPVQGVAIELDRIVTPLPVGRRVIVTGTTPDGAAIAVDTRVTRCEATDGRTVVEVADAVPPLVRPSVVIRANVVGATHGETVQEEVLGHGDASAAFQTFVLRQAPLTWVPAPPTGSESTLELRVGGIRWERVDSLHDRGPNERVYTLRRDRDGRTIVATGDGVTGGARLPSGVENVRARYRRGLGRGGEVGPGQLTLLQVRPAGLQGVTNPRPAVGGADPASFDEVRRDAPRDVLTLGRLVALQDYEDLAASFPGIGKARAEALWDGRRSVVHLTVISSSGVALTTADPTLATLLASIDAVRDPGHRVRVSGHRPATFAVKAGILVDPAHQAPTVTAAVRAALVEAFAPAARRFGQPVFASEVTTVAQHVPGVRAVDLDRLYRSDEGEGLSTALASASARWDGGTVSAAELLVVDPEAIEITQVEDT